VQDSDTYDYFETLYDYGEAGPPAYLVFKNVNYTNPDNLVQMNLIAAQLATLNDTVLAPVYSWTSAYQNFITRGAVWSESCGSEEASFLSFDGAMKKFTAIEINSECCQSFGICGEQYSLDIIFDDLDVVRATRYRFQHQVMKTQDDYIRGVLETRRACDEFGKDLTQYDTDETIVVAQGSWSFPDEPKPQKTQLDELFEYVGLPSPNVLIGVEVETEAPVAYTYSLYYVYYDQYSYIRGVLFQNVFIGVGAIIVSMQVISSLWTALLISLCVFLVFFELMGVMWMCNIVLGGYPVEINAVFVVNLITSLGFGVEFCNHIGMNFLKQKGTRVERAQKAMNAMGSSVVVGIASTKLLGIMVLAFAPSSLFRLYYFRMYLFIIILGVFNGLCFLPVMLSHIGPPQNEIAELEEKANMYEMRKVGEKTSGYRTKSQ
jgi:Niemann-Pick C1 protein